MASEINSSTGVNYTPPSTVASQQPKASSRDSDGDNDGSKVGEVEKPKASPGNTGLVINTTA